MWVVVLYSFLGLLLLLLMALLIPAFLQLDFLNELSFQVRFLGIPVFRFCSDKPSDTKEKVAVKKAAGDTKHSFLKTVAQILKDNGVVATVQYIQKGASLVGGAMGKILKIITVNNLIISLTVASEDAAHTAQDTGKICAVLYPAITSLQSVLKIRRREVTVTPDFLAEKGRTKIHVVAHVMPLRALWVGISLFRQYSAWQKSIKQENKEEVSYGK